MKDQYAVITGASSGIGMEFAGQLAKEGYHLVLVARRKDRLEQLAKKLQRKDQTIILITADLSRLEECEKLIEKLSSLKIAVFINNAGFGDCGRFTDTDINKELEMVDVNIKAMHYLMKHVLRQMEQQDRGQILNVASSAGLLPAGPYMATYYATKAYVASLTRAVATELSQRKSNVYVGALCPGPVNTEFNKIANVKFALPGITPKYCVAYARKQMKKKKTVIIPTFTLKAATTLGRFIPQKLLIVITGHQQKKKFQVTGASQQ